MQWRYFLFNKSTVKNWELLDVIIPARLKEDKFVYLFDCFEKQREIF